MGLLLGNFEQKKIHSPLKKKKTNEKGIFCFLNGKKMDQLWEKFIYAKHIMNLFMSNIAKASWEI